MARTANTPKVAGARNAGKQCAVTKRSASGRIAKQLMLTNPRLTLSQQFAEREHRIQERISILCGAGPITDSALKIAEAEADAWVREYNGITEPKIEKQKELF
jgi:hypothetical protein